MNNRHLPWGSSTLALSALIAASLFAMVACGGAGQSSAVQSSGTPLSIGIGDAPADRVVSFEITINSLALVRSDGTSVNVLSSPRRLELTHLSGTIEHVAFANAPAGSYASATVAYANPEVTFIAANGLLVHKELSTTGTLNISLNPPVTLGGAASVLSFDVDASQSINIDLATNGVTISPVFSLQASAQIPSDEQEVEPEDGELRDIVGQVTGVAGSSFTISLGQTGASMTFQTNSSTEFKEGLAGVSALSAGMIVQVEGITRADGSLLAQEVESESENGAEAEGLVVTIDSPSQFQMVAQDGGGAGMVAAQVGQTVTVNHGQKFAIGAKNANLSSLPFAPTFNAVSLGQRVEADSDAAVTGTTVQAGKIKLLEQSLSGVVSNSSPASFTLTVAADSAFRLITSASTVTVYRQNNTQLKGLNSISDGATVRVRGLLFFDGSTYRLFAGRITQ